MSCGAGNSAQESLRTLEPRVERLQRQNAQLLELLRTLRDGVAWRDEGDQSRFTRELKKFEEL